MSTSQLRSVSIALPQRLGTSRLEGSCDVPATVRGLGSKEWAAVTRRRGRVSRF